VRLRGRFDVGGAIRLHEASCRLEREANDYTGRMICGPGPKDQGETSATTARTVNMAATTTRRNA
jgi:hypothetical protein